MKKVFYITFVSILYMWIGTFWVNAQDEVCEGPTESLNDIRFENWSSEDWLDNDYIRVIRQYIDDYHAGKVVDENLDPYREQIKGRFIIGDVSPFIAGGLFFYITFEDMANRIFNVWVYSHVDEEKRTIIAYEVRRISIGEEDTEFTKEELYQIVREHPELKWW